MCYYIIHWSYKTYYRLTMTEVLSILYYKVETGIGIDNKKKVSYQYNYKRTKSNLPTRDRSF